MSIRRRHSDRVAQFSHVLTQIKFIILEIVIFLGFLAYVWGKAKHDFNLDAPATSAQAQASETHDPCHVTLPVFRSD